MNTPTDDTIAVLMSTTSLDVILCAVARVVEAGEKAKGAGYGFDSTKIRKLIGELGCAGSVFPLPPPAPTPSEPT